MDDADELWATADLVCKVKEPLPEEYHRLGLRPDQTLFTYLHLAASRGVHRRAARGGQRRHRVRDGPSARQHAPAARADERGRRPDGPADGCPPPHATGRRAGRARLRRAGRPLRPGRHPRGGGGRLRRRHHRRRHAFGGVHPRPQPRQAARGRPPLPRRARDDRLVRARDRGDLRRGRHRHRRRPGRRRPGPAPRLRRPRRADASGLGPRRHLGRPGWLLRVDAPHDPLEPRLRGPRLHLLLRLQHARRRAAHLDARPGQRHAAVHHEHRRPGLAARRPVEPRARPRASTSPMAGSSTSPWPTRTASSSRRWSRSSTDLSGRPRRPTGPSLSPARSRPPTRRTPSRLDTRPGCASSPAPGRRS